MKRNIITLFIAILLSSTAIAQRQELKSADRALKKGNIEAAERALKIAEALITTARDTDKLKYHYLKAKFYYELIKREKDVYESINNISKEFVNFFKLEANGKNNYSIEVRKMRAVLVNIMTKEIKTKYEEKDLKTAAMGYEGKYKLLSSKDTVLLYNAASIAYEGREYDLALKYYKELKDKKYTSRKIAYAAINKQTGEETEWSIKQLRDIAIVNGTHSDPKENKTPSKRGEILKKIALIYIHQKKNDDALKALVEARSELPDDVELLLKEAKIRLDHINDKESYLTLMSEALEKDLNNPYIPYEIGTGELGTKQYEESRKYFQEAIKRDSIFIDAILGLSDSYTNEANDLIDGMKGRLNRVSSRTYSNFLKKVNSLLKNGAKILEETLVSNEDNEKDKLMLEKLKKIYDAMNDKKNIRRVNKMLEELEGE